VLRIHVLIKKKSVIIKPEGEFMKKRLFVTPEYTTAREIKQIRKELHLTQKEFAEFINCSKPTIERWERSKEVIRGPIVPFLKMLQKYPEYEQEVKVPEKVWPLRIGCFFLLSKKYLLIHI
jgi:DNA-binding transcriptional regulator YiaG